jgi:hypothetical protein
MHRLLALALLALAVLCPAAPAQTGNLLRNARFQDDWLTLLPENKNHHWCYSSEFYHRRDFNPDGWTCKGSWLWLDADEPPGRRRLQLQGPAAEITQRVNWVAVHDDRQKSGFPDAGGFPVLRPQRSPQPLRLVRDLTFRVTLSGQEVPARAGVIEVAWSPDRPGSPTASAPLPAGTFADRTIEVKLPAADWLKTVKDNAARDPKEAAETAKSGPLLPDFVRVAVRYQAPAGRVEVAHAELLAAESAAPGLLPDGDFQAADKDGYPAGWERPVKYRYFPPGYYYIFNTWHNANFANRGRAARDPLVSRAGYPSLHMIVAAGDEMAVASRPVALNQKEPRLIEVSAHVKTDQLCMLQIDAVNEKGERLDGFDFIHKDPVSVGTDGWRRLRQVFRPRTPVQSLRLQLCARGVNGYTLDDTSSQPQNNVAGSAWWSDVRLTEPESTEAELQARGVKTVLPQPTSIGDYLGELDLGERLLGDNVLAARIVNLGLSGANTFTLQWEFTAPSGTKSHFASQPQQVKGGESVAVRIPYTLTETCPPYSEYRGTLSLLDDRGKTVAASEVWFGTWTTAIDLQLGALYLRPGQKQFVRLNLGFTAATMKQLAKVRLDVVRRGTGEVLLTRDLPATPAAVTAQRGKIPQELRGDFGNLLLADLDVSALPLQPFNDPQRNWLVRATALDAGGKQLAAVESQPFCRQDHEPAQPAIKSVTVRDNLLYVNDRPWLPWGVAYGHNPVYDGPADPGPGKYRDLHNVPAWNLYDRHNSASTSRRDNDFNCLRYVAGSLADPQKLEKSWRDDNLYCSSAFVAPVPVFAVADWQKAAGGKDKLDALLAFCKNAPMVVSTAPGIEEAFGLFQNATPAQLQGLRQVVELARAATGKPVMVGHGGYWNRFEFERVPYFDIYDPETEPLYPANLHTDLWPLVRGKDKVIWLRPQMYEDVPFERWRFHTFVELMRGCRGWQIAHGPGDPSLFRGLHGELERLTPAVYSRDAGPAVSVEPWLEHWSRREGGKVYVIAATTHGLTLGRWQWAGDTKGPGGRVRLTAGPHEQRDETDGYSIGQAPRPGPSLHGIQNLPDARSWPKGSKLVQWVRLDQQAVPRNLVILAKTDGRWTHAASWGKFDVTPLRKDPKLGFWFLTGFYRHARGFLGWDETLVPKALDYIPDTAADMGALPAAGDWVKLEVPLEKIGATEGLLDGVAFLHEAGRVRWGHTLLVAPDGTETLVWGDEVGLPAGQRAKVRVNVAGLKAGTKVRVLFEDRELTAGDGHFVDDFRGQDLYQRFGGGPGTGYGDTPVALHIYEIASP